MIWCLSNTSHNASTSFLEYAAPVGLEGELKINTFVLGVIAFSNCVGVIWKLFSGVV